MEEMEIDHCHEVASSHVRLLPPTYSGVHLGMKPTEIGPGRSALVRGGQGASWLWETYGDGDGPEESRWTGFKQEGGGGEEVGYSRRWGLLPNTNTQHLQVKELLGGQFDLLDMHLQTKLGKYFSIFFLSLFCLMLTSSECRSVKLNEAARPVNFNIHHHSSFLAQLTPPPPHLDIISYQESMGEKIILSHPTTHIYFKMKGNNVKMVFWSQNWKYLRTDKGIPKMLLESGCKVDNVALMRISHQYCRQGNS